MPGEAERIRRCQEELMKAFRVYDQTVDVVSCLQCISEEWLKVQYFDRYPEMPTEKANHRLTPDFTILFNDGYGIIVDVKRTFPNDEIAFKKELKDLKEYDRKLTESEKTQEQSAELTYMRLARAHIIGGTLTGAKHYFARMLRVNPKSDYLKERIKRIDELHRFSAKQKAQDSSEEAPFKGPAEIFPEMTKGAAPDYPSSAEKEGVEGNVWVMALVAKTGEVLWAEVGKSSGNEELDEAAIAAAYKNKYKPGLDKGRAVNCWVTYKVSFALDN